jgi:mannan endo-1,4-beta-mannosidase
MIHKILFSLLLFGFVFGSEISLSSQGFTVSGTKLLDANGKEFMIRGVNSPHVWYLDESMKAMTTLAGLKVNCVRIVWQTNGSAAQLEKVIKQCIKLEIIPMVELHDFTGNQKAEKLLEAVAYYTKPDIKKVLLRYEKYILINIANEWGDYFTTADYWKESYMQAINYMRNAGVNSILVIDAPNWGQGIQAILQYGKTLLDSDPKKNILFSVHAYYFWNDPVTIDTSLQKAYDASIPLIIGEFGYNFNNGNNNLKCQVDHKTVLRKCNELGYGYLAWSWAGNDSTNRWLDMSDWKTLTWWGKEIFEGENGITSTAKKSSVFSKADK